MTNHTAAPPTVVRVSGPRELVAAVPLCLGFHPQDSLVLLCLQAPRGRVSPAMRVDLFDPDVTAPADDLVRCAVRHADSAVVICYYRGARPGCLDVLVTRLHAAEVPVHAVLSVREGLIRDASNADAERLDPGVRVLAADDPGAQQIAAASAWAGRSILPDRESLRATIPAPTGRRLTEIRGAINRRCEQMAAYLAKAPVDAMRTTLQDRTVDAFGRAVHEHQQGGSVTMATAAELIVAATDIDARDLLVAIAVGSDDPSVVPMLISVAAWCPPEDAPEICSVLAVAAYRFGDGALAQCAADRVLVIRPHHRLAQLLQAAMVRGLPPRELACLADIRSDRHRRQARRRDGRDGK